MPFMQYRDHSGTKPIPIFAVIAADDGSAPDSKAVVDDWNGRVGGRLVHIWLPYQGFRGGEIRNRNIHASAGEYPQNDRSQLVDSVEKVCGCDA